MNKADASEGQPASELISSRIAELGDWRGKTLGRMRALIHEADPDVVETFKWAKATSPGTPVWEHDGIIFTGESYKDKVKLTFAKGASLPDPSKLFNSSLDGGTRRAIDIGEGSGIDDEALKALTINPAQMWGVDKELGSLDPGKRANVVVANGGIGSLKINAGAVVTDAPSCSG